MRNQPNIIITGTPGVGKTTHCEVLASNAGLKHVAVNDVVKNEECYEGFDDELGSWIVDEDKLLDILELELENGGIILDWHACDLFPERLIDLVVVLRTDSSILYDRLEKRGYGEKKLEENLDAEIMEVLLEEARDAYDEHIVVELRSEEVGDMEENCDRLEEWVRNWRGKQTEMRRERGRVDGTMDDEDGSIQEENEDEEDHDGTEKEDGDAMDDGEES